jgi:hypothetical protein
MNLIVFKTLAGVPLAILGLSTPVAPQRDCIFMVHPQIEASTFRSKEGQIIFPDRPTEYPCSYAKKNGDTVVAFTNQNRIPRDAEGTWSASKDTATISGQAIAPFGD